jgi:hypothetical protein
VQATATATAQPTRAWALQARSATVPTPMVPTPKHRATATPARSADAARRVSLCRAVWGSLALGALIGGGVVAWRQWRSAESCAVHGDAVVVDGVSFVLKNGAQITDRVRKQVALLHNCTASRTQPQIVLDPLDSARYDQRCQTIYVDPTIDHETVLVHEMVHFFDHTRHNFQLPCALRLFDQVQYGDPRWGDGPHGYPYCYGTDPSTPLPNAIEYLAVLAEGYCGTGANMQCGPSRSYLENASNPVAVAQLECAQKIMMATSSAQ